MEKKKTKPWSGLANISQFPKLSLDGSDAKSGLGWGH